MQSTFVFVRTSTTIQNDEDEKSRLDFNRLRVLTLKR